MRPTDVPLVLQFLPGPSSVTHVPGETLEVVSTHAFDFPTPPHLPVRKGAFSVQAQPLSVSIPFGGGFVHHLVLSCLPMGGDVTAHLDALSRAELLPYVVHPFPETTLFRIQWRAPSKEKVRSLRFLLGRRNQAPFHDPDPPAPIAPFLLPRTLPAALRTTKNGLFLWMRLA